ncbi:MAG: DUF1223 domain-containing protein [Pseudomonadota bacterium]
MIQRFVAILFMVFGFIPTAQAEGPVVVELFTSQSCSSCPPADKVLAELESQDNIIALSCHVTYWNHLHWEDTLSQNFCSERQRDYALLKGLRGPYTPQVVVNGGGETVGSRKRAVQNLVKNAPAIDNIAIKPDVGVLDIALPDLQDGEYQLTLFTYGNEHTQAIPSGENRGRTVTYTNPVTARVRLGAWNGDTQILEFDTTGYQPEGGYVVIAQDARGIIHAAGRLKL